MALYDQGGGCACGLYKECSCTKEKLWKGDEIIFIKASNENKINYKYHEGEIIQDFKEYIDKTYKEHYNTADETTCFDAWLALGDTTPTFRNTALKYLWRYGKKEGNNKKDLYKALQYILMMLYTDHYKNNKEK